MLMVVPITKEQCDPRPTKLAQEVDPCQLRERFGVGVKLARCEVYCSPLRNDAPVAWAWDGKQLQNPPCPRCGGVLARTTAHTWGGVVLDLVAFKKAQKPKRKKPRKGSIRARILDDLGRYGASDATAISERLGISRHQAWNALDRLADTGCVRRVKHGVYDIPGGNG